MGITRRFIYLLACGLPLLALSFNFGAARLVFLAFNLVCLGLLVIDFFIIPSDSCLEIARAPYDKLYFQAENTISFYVLSRFGRSLQVTLKDALPDWHFTVSESGDMTQTLTPGAQVVFGYSTLPTKRGGFMFGDVHGYIMGALGFSKKYFVRRLPMEYKVFSDLRDLGKYRLMTQKKRLLEQGNRKVRVRGGETEFESLREYVPGDDFRKINWMVTARENKLILNEFETEKNQPVFILIDAGRPMSYSIKGYKKLDYAINAALILADIVNQQGDNSGLMVFDTEVKSLIMPGKGETHRTRLMEALYHIEDTIKTSDYEGAFLELLNRQKRRGMVFVFTDFESPDDAHDIAAAIQMLKRRHTPIISLMENESLAKLQADESGGQAAVFQKATALNFLEERRKMIRSLNAHGVLCVESTADNFALTAVNRYLLAKNNR